MPTSIMARVYVDYMTRCSCRECSIQKLQITAQ